MRIDGRLTAIILPVLLLSSVCGCGKGASDGTPVMGENVSVTAESVSKIAVVAIGEKGETAAAAAVAQSAQAAEKTAAAAPPVENTTAAAHPSEQAALAQAAGAAIEPRPLKYVGKLFDVEVQENNYFFVKGVFMVFGNKFGPPPKDVAEEEAAIWDQLLLSYEAFRRDIEVEQAEVDLEIGKIVAADAKATFDWKKDAAAFEKWLKATTNLTPPMLANQLRYLLQLTKLRDQVLASFSPTVTDAEAKSEFLNENNSLGVELAEFDDKASAEGFYSKVKRDARAWDAERAARPKSFKKMSAVSLEFLIDIWKFPREACYRMMKMTIGAVHGPEPIYKGYGVFKVLEKRPAVEADFRKAKGGYYEQIRQRKRWGEYGTWFEGLKKEANIIIYKEGGKNE